MAKEGGVQIRVSATSAKPPHGGNNENDEKRGILAETDAPDSSFNRIVRLSNYAIYGS